MTGRARRERAAREVERTIPAPPSGRFNQHQREQEAQAASVVFERAIELARHYPHDPAIRAVHQKAFDAYYAAKEAAYPPEFWEDVAQLRAGDPAGLETAIRFLEADPYFFGSGHVKENLLRYLKRFDLPAEDRQRLEAVILGVVRRHNRHEFTEYRRLARRLDSPTLRAGLAECRQSDEYEVGRRARWMQAALDRDEEAPLEERKRRLMER